MGGNLAVIETIKAYKLFNLVDEKSPCRRLVAMKIPIRRRIEFADYSLRLLELMSVIASIRIVGAERMFEFGTFCGNTTLHMALNSSIESRIWTLDADDAVLEREGLREIYSWRTEFPLEFEGTRVEGKIHCLRGDSHTFDFSEWAGKMDLVLIDGDHSREGVDSDTRNARKMIGERSGVIVWHDYQNPDCIPNTKFLDELSEELPIFHIRESMLALHFTNPGITRRIMETP
jgi:Methyltransferase domain